MNTPKRSTLAIVTTVALAVWIAAYVVGDIPSSATHDRYWVLFVAPQMFSFLVGIVAAALLALTFLPERSTSSRS